MKLKNSLCKKLKQYSAMAAPMLALVSTANAQTILYHDVIPDYEFTTSPGTSLALHIDIDADGTADLNMQIASQVGGFNFAGVRPHSLNGNEIMGFLNSSSYYASALNNGDPIDGNGNFWSQTLQYGNMLLYFLPNGSSGVYGEWQNNVTDKYLGFRFLGGDGIKHYGWIRMDVFQNPVKIVVKDWAYESDSAIGIAAGDKCNDFFPSISALGSTTFCDGGSVVLETDSVGSNSYEWLKDEQSVSGATGIEYTATSEGNYTVLQTDSGGCTGESSIISVTVNPLPQPVITQVADTLYSNALGVSYQWSLNGNSINGATEQNYVASESGSYSVIVTDSNGCTGISDSFQFFPLEVYSVQETEINIFTSGKTILIQFNNEKYLGKEIKIVDEIGEIIFSGTVNSQNMKIDLTAFAAGLYMISINKNELATATKIVIG